MLPFAPAKPLPPRVYVNCEIDVLKMFHELYAIDLGSATWIAKHKTDEYEKMTTYVKKNIDTPRGPRPANTPVPGNMIIPSIEVISIHLRITTRKNASETDHLSIVRMELT